MKYSQSGIESYLDVALADLYDRKGFTHRFPVTFIIDGAHFGTAALERTGELWVFVVFFSDI